MGYDCVPVDQPVLFDMRLCSSACLTSVCLKCFVIMAVSFFVILPHHHRRNSPSQPSSLPCDWAYLYLHMTNWISAALLGLVGTVVTFFVVLPVPPQILVVDYPARPELRGKRLLYSKPALTVFSLWESRMFSFPIPSGTAMKRLVLSGLPISWQRTRVRGTTFCVYYFEPSTSLSFHSERGFSRGF